MQFQFQFYLYPQGPPSSSFSSHHPSPSFGHRQTFTFNSSINQLRCSPIIHSFNPVDWVQILRFQFLSHRLFVVSSSTVYLSMSLSEYDESEFEEDSQLILSDEEADSSNFHHQNQQSKFPPHHHQAKSSGNDNTPSNSQRGLSTSGSVLSNNSSKFIDHIDLVMNKIKGLQSDQQWSRVIKHRTGVQVFVQKNVKVIGNSKMIPIFKGVGLIRGYSPASVFAVVGSSKLWDEWYEDGNLVENLNDQVSLTYMCMKAGIGTRTRDLSLVEKVEVAEDGSIYFCASSIDTPRVPTVPGRIRAHIELHAWVLEPIFLSNSSLPPNSNSASTKVTYYLQVDVKTFVAEAISQRYLARRPLCITKIDSYLQKRGSPIQIDGLNQAESQPGQGGTRNGLQRNYMSIQQLDFSPQTNHARLPSSTNNTPATRSKKPYLSNMNLLGHKFRHRLASSNSSPLLNPDKKSPRSLPIGYASSPENPPKLPQHIGWIKHLMPNEESFGWNKSNDLVELFLKYLEDSTVNRKNWKAVQNATNSSPMLLNFDLLKCKQAQPENLFSLPLVKSQATLVTQIEYQSSPVTPEQVLVTILSSLAQQIWDAKLHGYSKLGGQTNRHQVLLRTENGFDQNTYLGTMRAVYPHIRDELTFCFDQLVVRRPKALDNVRKDQEDSKIVVIHNSIEDEKRYLEFLSGPTQSHFLSTGLEATLREKVNGNLLSRINLGGWLIQTGALADEIEITHMSALQLNLKNQSLHSNSLPPFLIKLITCNLAERPHQVSQFIQTYGFAPGFVRWMGGEIEYLGDFEPEEEGIGPSSQKGVTTRQNSLLRGEIEWRFRKKALQNPKEFKSEDLTSSARKIEQTCWFQWSDQMYPNGIDLSLKPASAVKVRIVQKLHNTLQFTWNKSLGDVQLDDSNLIKLTAKRLTDSKLSLVGQVVFNGSALVEPAPDLIENSMIGSSRVRKVKKGSMPNLGRSTKNSMNGSDMKENTTMIHEKTKSKKGHMIEDSKTNFNTNNDKRVKIKPKESNNSLLSNLSINNNLNDQNSSKILIDANVMLIINQNLYFTRSQVFFMFIFIGLAYVYGKLG
ncbi:hypothetical protein O181_004659 [Austropuccinia psidii MF-1]|uniref:START domain-containing protein n=1 Tax=Austropuccinia psidii MF-1 TaxID=1389203 RepID=A0A9Q3BGM7_9BASI|nr:hypothetical protein [Austropuccinia psidii MF-1]